MLTSLDDEQVLGVNVAMLGLVEVLLGNENALCGDRVSAYPYMQQSRENVYDHAIAMASMKGGILTSEEVPEKEQLALLHLLKRGVKMKLDIYSGNFLGNPQRSIVVRQ